MVCNGLLQLLNPFKSYRNTYSTAHRSAKVLLHAHDPSKKTIIDCDVTSINISDAMIDDRIFKSLWHCRKIAFASEYLPVPDTEVPPQGSP